MEAPWQAGIPLRKCAQGQDYFKQSSTRLHFIADRVIMFTQEGWSVVLDGVIKHVSARWEIPEPDGIARTSSRNTDHFARICHCPVWSPEGASIVYFLPSELYCLHMLIWSFGRLVYALMLKTWEYLPTISIFSWSKTGSGGFPRQLWYRYMDGLMMAYWL